MSKNTDQLPYFKNKTNDNEIAVAYFFLRKFRPKIKKSSPSIFWFN